MDQTIIRREDQDLEVEALVAHIQVVQEQQMEQLILVGVLVLATVQLKTVAQV